MKDFVREPSDNVFGRWKVMRRVDGRYWVQDTIDRTGSGPVFGDEDEARAHAQSLARYYGEIP